MSSTRSNPGGLLDQAIEVSDAFLNHGEIVSQRGREKDDIERFYAKPGDLAHGLPIILLVDAGSASAAEIVAGALQDHRRAIVMGERSFGKGSVQTVVQTGPQSALRLTTARYFTPSGKSVQAGGIDPDIVVPQLTDPDYKDRPRVREADLRRHLISQAKADDKLLEHDEKADPRFAATAAELEKKGVKDFQLEYAIKTLKRLAPSPASIASAGSRPKTPKPRPDERGHPRRQRRRSLHPAALARLIALLLPLACSASLGSNISAVWCLARCLLAARAARRRDPARGDRFHQLTGLRRSQTLTLLAALAIAVSGAIGVYHAGVELGS